MPSIAHLVMGGIIGLALFYLSDGKFSKTHVFVFFMNNYFGPDVGHALGLTGLHAYHRWIHVICINSGNNISLFHEIQPKD